LDFDHAPLWILEPVKDPNQTQNDTFTYFQLRIEAVVIIIGAYFSGSRGKMPGHLHQALYSLKV
jgi:hypothetical protein